jgi:hypothetical protein
VSPPQAESRRKLPAAAAASATFIVEREVMWFS